MKKFMKILLSVFLITVIITAVPFQHSCAKLHKDVLRLHILANSDSSEDQKAKLIVRDTLLAQISPLYNGVKTKNEAINITRKNLDFIEKTAKTVILNNGLSYNANAKITQKFFSTRYYDGFTLPAGMYDTLEITLGKAQGHNWWCVMYPTLCVGASSKTKAKESLTEDEYKVITDDDFTYRFKIVEYYEKIVSIFR